MYDEEKLQSYCMHEPGDIVEDTLRSGKHLILKAVLKNNEMLLYMVLTIEGDIYENWIPGTINHLFADSVDKYYRRIG